MTTTSLHHFASIIKNGGVVLFPTDTVWGLGCSIERLDAIKRFYDIKKREKNKPTAVLVGSKEMALQYGEVNKKSQELMTLHWPGALTIITQAKKNVPKEITGRTNTIGLRFPKFELVEQLTQMIGCGLVTGSANFTGNQAPTSRSLIDQELIDIVDAVYDGECGNQPPSTVIDATQKEIKIIRQGSVKL